MKKNNVLNKLAKSKVVCVVRADNYEDCCKIIDGCIAGGINAIEVTYTMSCASKLIEKYSNNNEIVVGAGSVLDAPTTRIAILAGAKYIVSPSFDKECALMCNKYQVPYIPGCMTINEIVDAMSYGSEICKLFPANLVGVNFIKAVKGPLPQVEIMPTGGVNLDNIKTWFESGAIMVGIGSEFTKLVKEERYDYIEKLAHQYIILANEVK